MSLKDKVVVVTGATGSLGRVVVETFMSEGAHVVSMYRSEQRLKELEDFLIEPFNKRQILSVHFPRSL